MWSNVMNLPPPGSWLITLGKGAVSGIHCWSLLLAGWAFSSGRSKVSLGDRKSVLLRKLITSTPVIMATLFMSPVDDSMGGLGEKADCVHRTGHSLPGLGKASYAEATLWGTFTQDTNIFPFFAYSKRTIHTVSRCPYNPFSDHVLSKSLAIQPTTGHHP